MERVKQTLGSCISILLGSAVLAMGAAAAQKDLSLKDDMSSDTGPRFVALQLHLDRIKVIKDGDPGPRGKGELQFFFHVWHTSPICAGRAVIGAKVGSQHAGTQKICDQWSFNRRKKAKDGDTVAVRRIIPGGDKYVILARSDMILVEVDVTETDTRVGQGRPGVVIQPIEPDIVLTAAAITRRPGERTHTVRTFDNSGKHRVEAEVHYRLMEVKPDLVLEDFWTVPAVPNTGYTTTKLCVKVRSAGDMVTGSYTPTVYVDNMGQPYSTLSVKPSLSPGSRQDHCWSIPTPPEGRHRLRAALRLPMQAYDYHLANNQLDKDVSATKRLTYQEAWLRARRHVAAFGKQVEELKEAFGLSAASRPTQASRIMPVGLAKGTEFPLPAWKLGSAVGQNQVVVAQALPRFDKRTNSSTQPGKGGKFKRETPRRFALDQQEILKMVSNLRSRCIRIQDEAKSLRHAYRELEKLGGAEATTKLIDKAKFLYDLGGHLDRAVRDVNIAAIETHVGALVDGGKAMTRQLNALRKLGG